MARARQIPGLEPSTAFRDAAAAAVEVRAEELFSLVGGVLDTDDIERVHDMRVATRRLRAVMEIFAPCFPRSQYRDALRQVKALADALGERRDPDVAIAALERVQRELGREEAPGIESLTGAFREAQGAANTRLSDALATALDGDLQGRLLALAAQARSA